MQLTDDLKRGIGYIGSVILAYHISKGYFSVDQQLSFFVVCGYH